MVTNRPWRGSIRGVVSRSRRAGCLGERRGRVVATSSRLLWQVLTDAYARLGLEVLADEAFRAMVLARNVEPASKADSLRTCWLISARRRQRCGRCSGH